MNDSFQELIDFAIEQEQEAADYYVGLAGNVKEQHVRQTLLEFAGQERRHKERLELVKRSGEANVAGKPPVDLKISDYLVEIEPSADLTFQGALTIAMKREKAAFRLYTDLARQCADAQLREVFLFLAHEEANHKLSFEVVYDDLIFQEN